MMTVTITAEIQNKLNLENTGPNEVYSVVSHPLVSTLQLPSEALCVCA